MRKNNYWPTSQKHKIQNNDMTNMVRKWQRERDKLSKEEFISQASMQGWSFFKYCKKNFIASDFFFLTIASEVIKTVFCY